VPFVSFTFYNRMLFPPAGPLKDIGWSRHAALINDRPLSSARILSFDIEQTQKIGLTRLRPNSTRQVWGIAVLTKISEEMVECLARAEEARQRAKKETDPRLRDEWLEMERRWLKLLESLRFVA
jgi:hypothetical protein